MHASITTHTHAATYRAGTFSTATPPLPRRCFACMRVMEGRALASVAGFACDAANAPVWCPKPCSRCLCCGEEGWGWRCVGECAAASSSLSLSNISGLLNCMRWRAVVGCNATVIGRFLLRRSSSDCDSMMSTLDGTGPPLVRVTPPERDRSVVVWGRDANDGAVPPMPLRCRRFRAVWAVAPRL